MYGQKVPDIGNTGVVEGYYYSCTFSSAIDLNRRSTDMHDASCLLLLRSLPS